MNDYKINLDKIPWRNHAPGQRIKEHLSGNKKLRLVEFSEDFEEKGWCAKGHVGLVMEGSVKVLFNNGKSIKFAKGDIINIPSGNDHEHKAVISKGQKTKILFFEDI